MNLKKKYTVQIKNEASRLGFLSCGISKAEFLDEEAPRLEKWLRMGMHGEMSYMENHFEKRLDPRRLVPDSKSVISLLLNYYPQEIQKKDSYKVSKYAYGTDYHLVIKEKLKKLLHFISEEVGEVHGRAFVDSAPVLDKAWAARSGLGWFGKHSNLITKQVGSFYFIAELIVDIELEYDMPTTDHCGSCRACIDACPTEAIIEPYIVDGTKCISYLTIELKDEIPKAFKGKLNDWIFGCDICQDVCPWNRFSKPHKEPLLHPEPLFLSMNKNDWDDLTEELFTHISKKSALKRARFKGVERNINFIKSI